MFYRFSRATDNRTSGAQDDLVLGGWCIFNDLDIKRVMPVKRKNGYQLLCHFDKPVKGNTELQKKLLLKFFFKTSQSTQQQTITRALQQRHYLELANKVWLEVAERCLKPLGRKSREFHPRVEQIVKSWQRLQ